VKRKAQLRASSRERPLFEPLVWELENLPVHIAFRILLTLYIKFCFEMLLHGYEDSVRPSLPLSVNGGCSLPRPSLLEVAATLSLFAFLCLNVVGAFSN